MNQGGRSCNNWVELHWKGQRLYLPEYTRLFRQIEGKITKTLLELGFEECLFPKLLVYDQYLKLKNALPRFSKEWSKEVIDANSSNEDISYPKNYTLSHWQCEPFYYLLEKRPNNSPLRYFDKSGWTYRAEKDITDYHLFEFQRIECVWLSRKEDAEGILENLLETLKHNLARFGLKARVVEKVDEEKETGELIVRDIEVFAKDCGWVEVVGAHLHGRLFIKRLGILLDNDFYTGCCGIGTSRLTNILIKGT